MNTLVNPVAPSAVPLAGPDADGTAVVEPRVVTTPAATDGTAFRVLGALSFSHLLNDMIQSLILAIYPLLKDTFSLSFGQIGLITLTYQITASLLQPVVGLLHRQASAAVFAVVRHGLHALRACCCSRSRRRTACCWSRRRWSASARRCSIRSRRGSRAWRRAAGTASRSRSSRSAAMPARRSARCSPRWIVIPHGQAQRRVVLARRAGRDRRAVAASAPGTARTSPAVRAKAQAQRQTHVPLPRNRSSIGDRHPAAARVLEVLLPRQPHQLLHVLSDREVPAVGAGRAAPPVRVPGRGRGRHADRRADRRPHRPQARDLGVDPRRRAVHAAAAVCRPVLDERAVGRHRLRHRVRVLGDPRLRAGARAGQGRDDLGPVLRLRVRHGRRRRGGARAARRHARHRRRLPGLRVPAVDRLATVFLPDLRARAKG